MGSSKSASADLVRSAARAEVLLKQMASAARLRILCSLMEGDRTVGELVENSALSQSAVSQHLMKMRQAGLVEARRSGQAMVYRLCSMEVRALLSTLYLIYCGPAAKHY
jgi:DNA-binding transcriptional ArsR family regulator